MLLTEEDSAVKVAKKISSGGYFDVDMRVDHSDVTVSA